MIAPSLRLSESDSALPLRMILSHGGMICGTAAGARPYDKFSGSIGSQPCLLAVRHDSPPAGPPLATSSCRVLNRAEFKLFFGPIMT